MFVTLETISLKNYPRSLDGMEDGKMMTRMMRDLEEHSESG